MSKKPMSNKEYVSRMGDDCPYCGKNEVRAGGVDFGDDQCWRNCWCEACKKEWVEIFQMVGYKAPKTYEWTITIHGTGNTPEEAWADAEEHLMVDGLGDMDIQPDSVEEEDGYDDDDPIKEDDCYD